MIQMQALCSLTHRRECEINPRFIEIASMRISMTNSSKLALNALNQELIQEHDLPRMGVANSGMPATAGHTDYCATSWGAIFAGAAAAASLALILLLLGTGLGLTFVSPWSFSSGYDAGAITSNFGLPIPMIILIAIFLH